MAKRPRHDARLTGIPSDHLENPYEFGENVDAKFVPLAGSVPAQARLAQRQHRLACALKERGDPKARGRIEVLSGASPQTISAIMKGDQWVPVIVLEAIMNELGE